MPDQLVTYGNQGPKRLRDMGDGSFAEVTNTNAAVAARGFQQA